ncbi:MAG: adhesin [Neisseria sp.]|uniref:ACP-like domain-containing protein n=1 Tax=Neisseria sp. TaxID=192066 RepID=UPI0026DD89B4|nr:adhesin [Neisseria sp.]MDO4641761.1 adhesin [Neisseria sp.]
MKLLSAVIVLSSLVSVTGTAMAASDNPTVAKKTVSYRCQQGNRVAVTYGFNKQGLTTYASAVVKGRRVTMPIDLNRSDNQETYYGKQGGYVLGTGYMDSKSYRDQSIMITNPNDEIIYKDCSPR